VVLRGPSALVRASTAEKTAHPSLEPFGAGGLSQLAVETKPGTETGWRRLLNQHTRGTPEPKGLPVSTSHPPHQTGSAKEKKSKQKNALDGVGLREPARTIREGGFFFLRWIGKRASTTTYPSFRLLVSPRMDGRRSWNCRGYLEREASPTSRVCSKHTALPRVYADTARRRCPPPAVIVSVETNETSQLWCRRPSLGRLYRGHKRLSGCCDSDLLQVHTIIKQSFHGI